MREKLRAGLREYFQHKIRTLVAMSVFAWVAMTLYQDKVDDLCVQELLRYPENGSIYRCFRTFLHGFCLYLILLLLAHLSDMQHRSSSSHVFTIPESTGPSMSFYPDFILILSKFYPDFILILS